MHIPLLSGVQLFATPWTEAQQAPLSFNYPLVFAQTHVHWVSDISKHLILCHSLHLLPSIFLSIRVFSKELAVRIRWLKYWSFSISPLLGLTSFRIDWFAVQGILKSLFQHHSLKASILRCSAIFMVQLSHPYMTTGKTVTLTTWVFVSKVMSLLFNTLSRVILISVHGITQTRILEWVAISSSRGSSRPSHWTCVSGVSCIGKQILCCWASWEALFWRYTSGKSLVTPTCLIWRSTVLELLPSQLPGVEVDLQNFTNKKLYSLCSLLPGFFHPPWGLLLPVSFIHVACMNNSLLVILWRKEICWFLILLSDFLVIFCLGLI